MLAADETPVNVLDRTPPARGAPDETDEADPEEKDGRAAAGSPHVLIVRTPDGRLTFLLALAPAARTASPPASPPRSPGT